MDDLILNVVSNPGPAQKQSQTKENGPARRGGKKQGGFDFKFSNKPQGKAVVVRRRVAKLAGGKAGGFKLKPLEAPGKNHELLRKLEEPMKEKKATESSNGDIVLHTVTSKRETVNTRSVPADKKDKFVKERKSSSQLGQNKDRKDEKTKLKKPLKRLTGKRTNEIKSYLFDKVELPELGKSRVQPVRESVFSGIKIEALSIHPHQIKNVEEVLGFEKLTKIQEKALPVALEGKDILLRSQTGSGKTLCYALPVVEKLHSIVPHISRSDGIHALVVVPTRELALQSFEIFVKLVKPFTWIVPGYFSGGEKRKSEKARLRNGINILIGTPGRLCDHLLHTEALRLAKTQFLILDEADRLFELGYEKDVRNIVDVLKRHRDTPVQTMLLSATLTAAVKELAGLTLTNPTFIDGRDSGAVGIAAADEEVDFASIPSTVAQNYVIVPPKLRLVTLSGIIAFEIGKGNGKLLIFMATQDLVDYHYNVMVDVLARQKSTHESDSEFEDDDDLIESDDEVEDGLLPGLRFFKLHGNMSQVERNSVFKEFRNVKAGVLLCTDVAARGIDVPKVDVVVQYDPPQQISDYVHRVGRTARAGRKGKAILFLGPSETHFIEMLETKKIQINQDNMEMYLRGLLTPSSSHRTPRNAAIELQREYEELVANEKVIKIGASKAFVSWIRFYSMFPRDLRKIFNIKTAHMGHHAKSMGLREAPTAFVKEASRPKPEKPRNRLTVEEKREPSFQPRFQPKTLAMATPKIRGTRVAPGGGRFVGRNNKDRHFSEKKSFDFDRGLKTAKMLNISEFDSGLPPLKKRKMK